MGKSNRRLGPYAITDEEVQAFIARMLPRALPGETAEWTPNEPLIREILSYIPPEARNPDLVNEPFKMIHMAFEHDWRIPPGFM